MKIHETLDRDPRESALANGGQARLTTGQDERALQELRAELETFVCEGQYGDALERMLRSYLTQLGRPRQNIAWVSGFFGSGKSHLQKVLAHLWTDTAFPDGTTARSLVRDLPDDVQAALRELDTHAARIGKAPVAAAGTLPSGGADQVRLTVLAVVLRAAGLPEKYPQAQFCFWLREQGWLDRVRESVEAAGKDWLRELYNLYVSGPIAEAVLACDPDFARDVKEARQVLRQRFPNPTGDITTAEFIEACRQALAPDGELPPTVLILDEVQQYIGDSTDRAVVVTEVAEAIQTQLDSRVMLVASGQSALAATPLLQKLKDRFRITVQLSDTDVEAVTRKVLLHKKASAKDPVQGVLTRNAGEVSKHLQSTSLEQRPSDRDVAVADYPLLPTRRRFWEECFRVVDAAGTHSQLRSQLRILHDALQAIATQDLGAVIPADALYEAIAPDMVNTGVLLNELATRIQELDDGTAEGKLRRRIGGVVFLIGKLPREKGVDVGVRPTARMVADLLVDDIEGDSGPFRRHVEESLEAMVEDGTLMKVGEEYRLQTTQGAEWDRAFREHAGAIRQRHAELQAKQDQLFQAAVQTAVASIRPLHGEAKVRRQLTLHARNERRERAGDDIVVWLRDGSSTTQKTVEGDAREAGHEDPTLYVFIPKPSEDLKARICEAEAAQRVLDAKGMPTDPPEAREACESMQSRRRKAEDERDGLIRDLLAAAKVYKGGGTEVYGEGLREKLEAAAEAALARRFPRFDEADHKAWPAALKRAKDGSDTPLQVVGWDGRTEEHPVVKEVLAACERGSTGAAVRKALEGAPFGWPRDAIDAALVALHRAGTVRVLHNGKPLSPGSLDQNKIAKAEFRPEKVVLSVQDKLALRGLYQQAEVAAKSGEEEVKAPVFLACLRELAREAGGEPPLPPRPSTTHLDEIGRLTGNEQLGALLESREALGDNIAAWRARAELARTRDGRWCVLERLAERAEGLAALDEVRPEMDAIIKGRTLLDDTDYVGPLCGKLEGALRDAIRAAHGRCVEVRDERMAELEASEDWRKIAEEQREAIVNSNYLGVIPPLDVGSEDALLQALERRTLRGWTELAEALPQRFARAREEAARALEPKVQRVSLTSSVLRSEGDVTSWVAEAQATLLKKLGDGPVVIG